MKVEHGAKKQGGFGACIFEVRLDLETRPLVPIGRGEKADAVPTVVCSFSPPDSLGEHPVTLRCRGPFDPARHELSLDVVPVKTSVIPPAQQDLTQMNPIFRTIEWPKEAADKTTIQTTFQLDRFGAAVLAATLRERQSGKILSRTVEQVVISREQVEPIRFALRQPFISTEATLPGELNLNLQEDRLQGATAVATLANRAGKRLQTVSMPASKEPIRFAFDVKDLAPGEYRVSVNVVGKDGQLLTEVDADVTKYVPPGRPKVVKIDQEGVCRVDGKPIMPLGFMLGGATPEAVEAGYPLGVWGCEYPNDPHDRAGIDRAAAVGGMVVLHVCNYLRENDDIEGLRARVSRLKNEPGLLAWYLADEPEGCGDTPELLRKAYLAIKEIDPNHPVHICTNAPGMLKRYGGCADVIGADPYPVPHHDLTQVADWTDATVRAAKQNGQAVWMTPQGFGWREIGGESVRAPTDDEFTCMLATCFIHGAKGILWWPYSVPRNRHWEHFKWMGRAARFIEPWILHGIDAQGMPAGPQRTDGVHWRIWRHEGRMLLLATNLSKARKTLSVQIPQRIVAIRFPFDRKSDAANTRQDTPADGVLKIELKPTQTVIVVLDVEKK